MGFGRWFAAPVALLLVVASCGGTGNKPLSPTPTPAPGPGQPSSGPVNVIRWHYDLAGTGNNDRETTLTPANVASDKFGKLFDIANLQGAVYAQPLYVPGLQINGQTHNVIFLATQRDWLYAFDADQPGQPLWARELIDRTNGETYLDNPAQDTGSVCCPDHEIGITGTPTIDTATNTLYVVARTKKLSPRQYFHKLYAIDITSGATKASKVVQATVPGTADAGFFPDSPNTVTFDRPFDQTGDGIVETHQNQRGGLLLLGSSVYVTWASHTDIHPYYGWAMAFDKTTLNITAVFCAAPNDEAGGIWMSGAAPTSDGTSIFFATGNGDANPTKSDYAQSVLRMNQNLSVADYFTPFNWSTLNLTDLDLAASAPILLPDQAGPAPHLVVMTGKEGSIYLLNRDNLGKFQNGSDSQIVQAIPRALPGVIRSVPAFWNGFVYYAGGIVTDEIPGANPANFGKMDVLKAFRLDNGRLSATPVMQGSPQFFFPGATPWISSNGTSNGIVWVVRNPPPSGGEAILEAYDAMNLSNLLFNSTRNAANRTGGDYVRFVLPVVVNGKVYVSSHNNLFTQGRISVFGLRP